MFHLEPSTKTIEMRVSVPIPGSTKLEYVPSEYNKLENWILFKYRRLLDKFNVQHYYWHYRYLLNARSRKSEDILFMIHVYKEHGGKPTDTKEASFYNKMMRLYGVEFTYLIQAKIDEEKNSRGISDVYAQAYYKKWLRPKTPNMKRLYHGVDNYEIVEMIDTISGINMKEYEHIKSSIKYADQKVKKAKIKSKAKK